MKKYVITGGPGIGKTTVIELLAARGYAIVPEVARMVTEEEKLKKSGILPWKNLAAYQQKVAERQLEAESAATGKIVFLDRGLMDGYGYCVLNKIPAPKLINEQGKGRYEKVFLLDQLPNYKNDSVRFEDREEALRIHRAVADAYAEFGYHVISVPVMSPKERLDFILERI